MIRPRLLLAVMAGALGLWLLAASSANASATTSLLGPTPRQGTERRGVHPETGRLSFLGFDPGQGPVVPGFTRGMSAQAQARAGIGRYAAEFGIRDANRELQVMEVRSGERSRVRYQQVSDGVPVVGGELVVNVRANGELSSINGEISPDLTLEVTPQISAEAARATALDVVAKAQGVDASTLRADKLELWIYDARLLAPSDQAAELVWRTEVRAEGAAAIRELVLISAVTGEVSLHFNQVDTSWGGAVEAPRLQITDTETPTDTAAPTETETPIPSETSTAVPSETPSETAPVETWTSTPEQLPSETPSATESAAPTATASETPTEAPSVIFAFGGSPLLMTYTANNGLSLPGTFLCDETSPNCTNGSNPHADAAHVYALDTYDFYWTHHGRDSLDGNGMTIVSTVHYAYNYWNAFWNGDQIVFGDGAGFPLADDVVAHELTHGVTDHESGLFYYYQSGAINESLSDVFSEFVDQTNGKGNDSASVKWLQGEDIAGLGAIRSLKNPPSFGDPDKMTSTNYYLGDGDNGGVHYNSGINNKAAYLLTDGGSFNGYNVRGLGITKAAAIYYQAQTNYLTSGSDYYDLYYILFQACQDLVGGPEGITASDCLEVRDATGAVEMNLQPVGGFNPHAEACPTGGTRDQELFSDDLEGGLANWSITQLDWATSWTLATGYAHSGDLMLWADDSVGWSDSVAAMSLDVALPPGAFLRFAHAFLFSEPYWGYHFHREGGLLEYSTDGGATWLDAEPLFSAGRAYGSRTVFPWGWPIVGRRSFVWDSHGYNSSRYDLDSLAGQSVRFRWRASTDEFTSLGWFVDDVEIYTCVGTPAVPSLSSPAANALVTSYTPVLDWADAAAADHYDLQVADNSAFSSPIVDEQVTPSDYSFATPLADNGTYWWRVRTVNLLGVASDWSAVRTFRTVILPPALASPVDSEILQTARPTFDWGDVIGASGYTLNVAADSSFASLEVNKTTSGSQFTMTWDLDPRGATFYWRVRANGANGPSLWSPVWSLTSANPPSIPTLVSPAGNALLLTYTPTLDWGDSTGGFDHYQLQVATSSGFSSPTVDDSTLATSTYSFLSALDPNTTYWWRVRAGNAVGQYSLWSAVRTFRTVIVTPGMLSPNDGATLLTTRPTFDWSDVAGASNYTLQVSTVGSFASTVLNTTVVPSTYAMTSDLNPKGVTMYWRVRANGTNGPSTWSAVRSLTSASPPSVPGLISPASNALLRTYTPTLDWNDAAGGVDHYQLQVATNSGFSSPVVDDPTLTPSTYTFASALTPNTTYWWRVRSFNAAGQYSQWSSAWTFRMVMVKPILTSPADGEGLLTTRPTFDWGDVAGNSNYTLQVSTINTFASTVLNVAAPGSNYTMMVDLNPKNALLYWRVRANGANGPSDWSDPWTITSASPPSIPVQVSPANNALVMTYTPTLDWKDSTGGVDHYQLQVAVDSGFTSPVVDDSTLTSSTFAVGSALNPNTKYWWRVRSYNAGGQYSQWSASWAFRAVMLAPGLTSPAEGATLLSTRPTFDWGDVAGASNYTLQVATVNTFASTVLNVTATPSTYTMTADLNPKGATLYWRVRANGTNGPSPWSVVRTVISAQPPSIPALASPAANALVLTYTPTLDWGDSTGGLDHYQLQLASNGAFTSPLVDDDTLTVSTYALGSALNPNMTYWWRVRSFNAGDQYSQWPAARTFRTVMVPPSPALPGDAEVLLTTRPTFDWSDVPGASTYTLQVSTVNTFASTVLNVTPASSTYTMAGDLNPKGVTLYWRVRANGTNGPTAWSSVWTVTSAQPPSVPTLVSPAGNALLMSTTPTLDWSDSTGGLDHYQLQVASNAGFASPEVDDSSLTMSTYAVASSLSPSTKYWWRVRSFNAGGQYSPWSAVRTFRTVIASPIWVTPTDGAVLTAARPLLDWTDSSGVTTYTLQISINNFSSFLIRTDLAVSQYQPSSSLPLNRVIDLRVRANGPNGPTPWVTISFIIIP